jgi:general secretion pathway protein C
MSSLNFKKINNVIALLCTLVLIVVTASIISKVVWQVLDKETSFPMDKALSNNIKNTPTLSLPINLFGALNSAEKPNHSKIENTRLNLVLVGILSKQENPSVIITKEDGKEKIYQINDYITPNTILKEVFSQYVILERNGIVEKLEIKRTKINTSKLDKKPNFQITEPNKLKLKGYLEDLKTKPEKLFDILSVQPNFNNGELSGFIIAPGIERALFEDLGFQKNDIIMNINNNELNNLSQAIKLRDVFTDKKLFDIIIKRKGQTKYLSINLN